MRRPCEECDFIGPELPSMMRDARELHRAMHGFIDAIVGPVADWQMRVLDRAIDARAKGPRSFIDLPRRKP